MDHETKTTLTFTGDIGFDKYMDGKWNDDTLLEPAVLDFLRASEHLIVNVEGPLSDGQRAQREGNAGKLVHSMNPEAAGFLNKINADVWNICNNHIMDAGPEGLADTLALAEKINETSCRNAETQNTASLKPIHTLGAGLNLEDASKPVIFPEAGGIGMIGVGYQRACRKAEEDKPGCFSWSDLELIERRIKEIKSKCRWCIVVAHAGEEFTALPAPYTKDRYHKYLEMGADIVIAHHPHVPMNYETVGDKAIFYSLGNFVFDTDYQRSQFNTEYGIFIKLHFTEGSFSFEPFGIKIDRSTEKIVKHSLPKIFENVGGEEYEKLLPLAAKVFIENTKRQLRYMKPDKFMNATDEQWLENFYEPLRSGRVPGETLDMQIMYPISLKESEKTWKTSKLDAVVEYMLEQLPE